jgi:hypothetical protein
MESSRERMRRIRAAYPEYNSWRAMKERCENPNHVRYHRYGGRAITIRGPRVVSYVRLGEWRYLFVRRTGGGGYAGPLDTGGFS